MIALISFQENLVMTREEADKLRLKYSECERVGLNDGKLINMHSSYHYKDEVVEKDGDYYFNDEKTYNFCIVERPIKILDWVYVEQKNHLVDLLWFTDHCNYPFYIEKAVKSEEPTIENLQYLLNKLGEKAWQVDKMLDIIQQQIFNQKVNVHLGGGLIVTYNDLCLKQDCCTDELQGELNNGWRIIAVCVQPDQRRPDYILGRYNPELDVYKKPSADR